MHLKNLKILKTNRKAYKYTQHSDNYMPNTNYKRGYKVERDVVNQYRKLGHIAYRSSGSHTPFDVTVHLDTHILVIQLKRTKKKGINFDKDIKSLRDAKTTAKKEFWIYRDYEKKGNKWQKIEVD